MTQSNLAITIILFAELCSALTVRSALGDTEQIPFADQSIQSSLQATAPITELDLTNRSRASIKQHSYRGGHLLQIDITGSSCLACLKELERKLQLLPGINKVYFKSPLFDKDGQLVKAQSTKQPITTTFVLLYDKYQSSPKSIEKFIIDNDFHVTRVTDKKK